MSLITCPYSEQEKTWPKEGKHILAQYDEKTIIVYQAYCSSIGRFAVENRKFGGDFSYERMSWIKTNFLWMMYRSGWGTKKNQEMTLALRLRREFFDSLLAQAVVSSWDCNQFPEERDWARAAAKSSVRVQWDPDHGPSGRKRRRRAIQLGLRGPVLDVFGKKELLEVIDLSDFVAEQKAKLPEIVTPCERVYCPDNPQIAIHLGLSKFLDI